MRIVVDGIIYQLQSRGGISRLYSEVLPRTCDFEPSLRVMLLTESGRLKQSVPSHSRIEHRVIPRLERYVRPRRLWTPLLAGVQRLLRRLWAGDGNGRIWHSTYYTLPEKWKGPQVVTIHDMIFERFADLFNSPGCDRVREQKRRCVHAADAVICVSDTTREDACAFYGLNRSRVRVVPLGHSSVFRQKEKGESLVQPPTSRPFILYVGDRSHYKNFRGLLKAYSKWPARRELDLVVVSSKGWSDAERRCLSDLGIARHVRLLTSVEDRGLCDLYNQAVAFVYPSLYEGFGIPLLEAMACGCPIVASRIPSTEEVAGSCPIYFDARDVESMVPALNAALTEGRNSPRCHRGLARAGKYSCDLTARGMLDVYYELAGIKEAGRATYFQPAGDVSLDRHDAN